MSGLPPEVAATLRARLALSQERGAIGPAGLDFHLAHAAAFAVIAGELNASIRRFVDLGSGGGLPGLVVAALLLGAHGVLLDGRVERARLLEEHVGALGWQERIEVVALRAEEAGRGPLRGAADLVVARGFAPPAVTAECAAPLLGVGGILVVSEPPESAPARRRWDDDVLRTLGLERRAVPETGWSFAAFCQVQNVPGRYPRRTGIPAKRPLF